MSKISLFNRKRMHELGQADVTQVKKDELLDLQLQALDEKAEKTRQLKDIALGMLLPDPNQPRKRFKNIESLAESIKQKGIIQPIIVTPKKEDGFFHIIAGERRFRAAKLAGLGTIPCIVRNEVDSDILILQLLENEQREKVSPFEEADALMELIKRRKVAKAEVAKSLGRDPSWISLRLKLAGASDNIRAISQAGFIEDVRTLYELKKFEDELPEAAAHFIEKLRHHRVKGAYRQAIKRAKMLWHKKTELHQAATQPPLITAISQDETGVFCFQAEPSDSPHRYLLKLSPSARSQLKTLLEQPQRR